MHTHTHTHTEKHTLWFYCYTYTHTFMHTSSFVNARTFYAYVYIHTQWCVHTHIHTHTRTQRCTEKDVSEIFFCFLLQVLICSFRSYFKKQKTNQHYSSIQWNFSFVQMDIKKFTYFICQTLSVEYTICFLFFYSSHFNIQRKEDTHGIFPMVFAIWEIHSAT